VPSESTVLVIDDEPAIEQVLDAALRARGYDVHTAANGTDGVQLATALAPDVLIVDLGLPDIDGIEVCRRLRRWTQNPIIVLTVDDGENRKVEALDAGADDYVTKPFSVPELLARVRVALRHRQAVGQVVDTESLTIGSLEIDLAGHSVAVAGQPVHLTPQEYSLLTVLARNAGKVLTHRTLLVGVWGRFAPERIGQLRIHVNQLRRKFTDAGPNGLQIVTEPGVGYRLTIA
jgi:two-component system, OmpR family, KDP operon response regulator KdpE